MHLAKVGEQIKVRLGHIAKDKNGSELAGGEVGPSVTIT